MRLVRRLIFAGYYLMICFPAIGQSLHFQHYSVEDGLASSIVYDAFQDSKGFIWFGTESGLSRFDGTQFTNFTTADGLPANTVFKVAESADGRLWISCYNEGVVFYENGRFYSAKNDSSLAQMTFPYGSYSFINASDGFYAFDPINLYKASFNNQNRQLDIHQRFTNTLIGGLKTVLIHRDTPFIMTSNGVYKIDNQQIVKIYSMTVPSTEGRYTGLDADFFYSEKGNVRRCHLDENGQVTEELIHVFGHSVELIKAPQKGVLWVQVAKEGVYRINLNDADKAVVTPVSGIQNINFVLTDKEGTTWFTTADNGIFALLSDQNFLYNTSNVLPNSKILSLEKWKNGQVLVGDAASNLITIRQGKVISSQKVNIQREFNRLMAIRYAPQQLETWIGTDEALFALDAHGKIIFSRPSAIKSVWIGQQYIWVGRGVALMRINIDTKKVDEVRYGEKYMAIAEDAAQNLWLGKLNGLEVISGGSGIKLDEKHPDLLKVRITGLAPATNNIMWVATHQNGVVALKNKTEIVRHFTTADGLTSNICQNIRIDDEGDIWVATNNGLNKIDHTTFHISKYSTINVLPDNDVNDVLVTGDTVWAATSKGIAIFKDEPSATNPAFHTLITGFHVNTELRLHNGRQHIQLPSDSCDLLFHFAALSFRSHGQFRYVYTIKKPAPSFRYYAWSDLWMGITNWYAGKAAVIRDTLLSNTLQMSNLPHGRYLLQVEALSYDGIKSLYPDQTEIMIRPTIPQCLWFQLLCLMALATALWRLNRWQINKKSQEMRIRQEMTHLKMEAFKAQINPHFIFNTINGIQKFFFPPDPAKANAYIVLFSGLLRKTLDFSEKITVPFAMEQAFLNDYLELTQLRVGEKFQYAITGVEALPPNTEIPTMLLQPLVENAIVHGFPPNGKAQLTVHFSLEGDRCTCRIEDNGIGIKASLARKEAGGDKRKSKGTQLVRQRVEAINQISQKDIRVTVQDKSDLRLPDSGTIATVSFHLD